MTMRAADLSPPDWAFFPGALLVAAAMVFLALQIRPAGDSPVFEEGRYQLEGAALNQLIATPGTEVAFIADADTPFVRTRALASMAAPGSSIGVAALLPADFEAQVVGRVVAVEAVWRAAPDTTSGAGLTQANLRYATTGGGDSGWRALPLGEAFEPVGFCYQVRGDAPVTGQEWVGVWPDAEGRGRAVDLRMLRATIQAPETTVADCEAALTAPGG